MIWTLTYKALALVFARINDGPREVRRRVRRHPNPNSCWIHSQELETCGVHVCHL